MVQLVRTIFLISSCLMIINLYGLTQNLRPDNFYSENLRFGDRDITLSQDELFESVKRKSKETDIEYASRLNTVISNGIAHIHWELYEPAEFNQRVPIWENWILYAMSFITDIKEYKRYHFSNPEKSMERGIGICGDASMIMYQLLEREGIKPEIVTFPGHVVVHARIEDESFIFDPDFGVQIKTSLEKLNAFPEVVYGKYSGQGYPKQMDDFFVRTYSNNFNTWNGPRHFITKKYYFEKVSYISIWLLPAFGMIVSLLFFRKCEY